jgi:hypothetical protein
LRRLLSSGRAASSLATVGHGAAVLGRHGRHLPSLLQPRLATLPPSPTSRASRASANSPCHGRQWPPASWASRAAATSQRRRVLCLSRARPKGRGPTPCWAVSPFLTLRPRRPKVAVGQLIPAGWPSSSRMNCFQFILYYLKIEMVWKLVGYSKLLQICWNKFV